MQRRHTLQEDDRGPGPFDCPEVDAFICLLEHLKVIEIFFAARFELSPSHINLRLLLLRVRYPLNQGRHDVQTDGQVHTIEES